MPRVVDRCRNGDAVVTAEYCTRALYGAIINMQRMKFTASLRAAAGGESFSDDAFSDSPVLLSVVVFTVVAACWNPD